MSHHRNDEVHLPYWLWFFLLLPMVLIVALLYRRRQLPQIARLRRALPDLPGLPGLRRERYQEPDSIPLNMATETGENQPDVKVTDDYITTDKLADEDISIARATARFDYESPGSEQTHPATDFAGDEARAETPASRQTEIPIETQGEGTADDLKIIEGIGPSIAGILLRHGISTFRQLANTPREHLTEILTEARLNRLADPETWPEQAQLAADGKWDELAQLQGSLRGGRRV